MFSIDGSNVPETLTPWMKAQLKFKAMVLIISLIEMKTSDIIVRKIMQFIPKDTLTNLMVECFKGQLLLYGEDYVEEAFKHYEERPDEVVFSRDIKENLYYETIMETGFYAFFIMLEYLLVEDLLTGNSGYVLWTDEAI